MRTKFFIVVFALVLMPAVAVAQFSDSLNSEEVFVEDNFDFGEFDFSDGGRFIEEFPEIPTQTMSDAEKDIIIKRALEEDISNLGINIGWGAAAGVLLGGVAAMAQRDSGVEILKTMGRALAGGLLLGLLAGFKNSIMASIEVASLPSVSDQMIATEQYSLDFGIAFGKRF